MAYSEQLGTNRQRGPSRGLNSRLYRRSRKMRKRSITGPEAAEKTGAWLPLRPLQGITARLPTPRESAAGTRAVATKKTVKKTAKKAPARKAAASKAPVK